MSDIKLFRFSSKGVRELPGRPVRLEKSLQTLIEKNLEAFLGIHFLGSEYPTSGTHPGRIDTLGIDENGCPVIIEYKRASNENIITQGLYYLDWLLDHRDNFKLQVMSALGEEQAKNIDWLGARLVCIANDFSRYDPSAVNSMERNIELIRYRQYSDGLLLFELVNATFAPGVANVSVGKGGEVKPDYPTASDVLAKASQDLRDRFEALQAFLVSLGDDVQVKPLKFYFAFRRIRNFACVEIRRQKGDILIYLGLDPGNLKLEKGFTRDVSSIGHYGTGDLEVRVHSDEDFRRAEPLLQRSYDEN